LKTLLRPDIEEAGVSARAGRPLTLGTVSEVPTEHERDAARQP
jgi:hypothetical protein